MKRTKLLLISTFVLISVVTIINITMLLVEINIILTMLTALLLFYLAFLMVKKMMNPNGKLDKHKKMKFLMKVEKPYGKNVEIYCSDYYDQYESIYKPIEIFGVGNQTKVVISEKYHKNHDSSSIDMLIDREILKHNSSYQSKSFSFLVIPILIIVNIMIFFIKNISIYRSTWGTLITDFLIPFGFLISYISILLLWNKYHSYLDQYLDSKLIMYYDVEDVCRFIEETEKEEGGYEKEKYSSFNKMHMLKRINKIKK